MEKKKEKKGFKTRTCNICSPYFWHKGI